MAYRKSVCVFCGSRRGDDPAFIEAATLLGTELARNGIRMVFGAGDVGMMGAAAHACIAAGGQTLGVIPTHLLSTEGPAELSRTVITENMHERKKVMFMNSAAAVTLPGGAGTLDELFEVLTWRQLGLHDKPVYLLDINGYWDPFVALIDHMIARGFADASFRGLFQRVGSVPELMNLLKEKLPLE